MTPSVLAPYQPYLLSLLRIVAALLMVNFGAEKILGFPEGRSPAVLSPPWVAGLIELTIGFALLVGYRSRLAAFVLSGLMAFAYWMRHGLENVFPSLNGGALAVLACFAFLYLCAAGPGPWSIDALLARRRGEADAEGSAAR